MFPTTSRAATENALFASSPPLSVLGTFIAARATGWAVSNDPCGEVDSGITVPDSANSSLTASRTPKYRSPRSLNRSDPTDAGELMMSLNVSNPADGPGYSGLYPTPPGGACGP